jgi:hypothetical protein
MFRRDMFIRLSRFSLILHNSDISLYWCLSPNILSWRARGVGLLFMQFLSIFLFLSPSQGQIECGYIPCLGEIWLIPSVWTWTVYEWMNEFGRFTKRTRRLWNVFITKTDLSCYSLTPAILGCRHTSRLQTLLPRVPQVSCILINRQL